MAQLSTRVPILDGVAELRAFASNAGYTSLMAAVAAHAMFLDPRTVEQTGGEPLFRVVRDSARRGTVDAARGVVLDDNSTPVRIFAWARGATFQGPENQVNQLHSALESRRHA